MPEWIGKTIGNVRIEKLLARGGMAEVYLGSHLNLERPVAIKLLHSYIEEEPLLLERFHREAKVVAGLRHSNIVQIFDFDTVDGHPYIVMEFLKGPTLATYLRNLHQRKKRIPTEQVARLLHELSTALDYAHAQGVVHRDIKPGNIMLHSKAGDVSLERPMTDEVDLVITDFGLVRIMNASTQTASGIVSGTPAYMSPEQARGDPTDHRTDIYSLGIVLYEMLAGRVPFAADSTLTVLHMQIHTPPPPIPGVSPAVQDVMDRALQKNPDDRYPTTRELTDDYFRAMGLTPPRGYSSLPPKPLPEPEPEPVNTLAVEAPAPPAIEPEPEPAAERPSQPVVTPKSEPALRPEPPVSQAARKPARGGLWIGAGLLSLVCLGALAFGGYRLFLARPPGPQPTAPVSLEMTPTAAAAQPSAAPALPSAVGMVKVAAGTYEVGTALFNDAYHLPPQEVALTEFWIDQYQTTNADYQKFIAETSAPPPLVWPGPGDKHPVRGVTWEQANTYCRWLQKRLPGEAEWEAAGRGLGPEPQLYPWGPDANAGGETLKLPNDNTYEVGTQAFNRSPLDVYDMVGNVWEWVGAPYGSLEAGKQLVRGSRYSLIYDLAFRVQVGPEDTSYIQDAGFRCAADQVSE